MDVGAGAPRGQLAVAERAGAPLAEQVVALRVERSACVEPADVGDPVLDGPAPLEDQRPITLLGQQVAGDQAGRARRRRSPGRCSSGRGPGLGPVEPLGHVGLDVGVEAARRGRRVLVGEIDLRRIGEVEVVVAAGVEALAEDPPARRSRRAPAPAGRRSRAGRLSSGSSSSRRMLLILTDMAEAVGTRSCDGMESRPADSSRVRGRSANRASGPKQIRVMSSTWTWPAENSRMSWRMARPTASGPPGGLGEPCGSAGGSRASRRAPRGGCGRRSRRRRRRRRRRRARA